MINNVDCYESNPDVYHKEISEAFSITPLATSSAPMTAKTLGLICDALSKYLVEEEWLISTMSNNIIFVRRSYRD